MRCSTGRTPARAAWPATALTLALLPVGCWTAPMPAPEPTPEPAAAALAPSAAQRWLDVVLEAAARDVERIGAQPTILSRQMAIPMTAMFDAWAAYDAVAVPSCEAAPARRPAAERTRRNRETAIAHAVYRTAVDQFPHFVDYLGEAMRTEGYDPDDPCLDPASPVGVGNLAAAAVLASRRHDGANQHGDERGSDGNPYSDYTMYRPVNPSDRILDPDRWQPIPFDDGAGGTVVLGFLTPHWYRVRPFALERADQFRPGPPPLVGSPELAAEVRECIDFNANLTPEQKAIVEFMRDGPRSTGQSGHWLRFAQAVSNRDRNDLDRDVQLFFAVANVAFDAFIAAWDSKRHYDSSRPWTLVRHLYAGQTLKGWAGPGRGVTDVPAEAWHPYSPSTFVTPPFPGYVSGHSCVSGACAELLKLFTGSDRCGLVEERHAGDLTEPGFSCLEMQQLDGRPLAEILGDAHASCDIALQLPTFSATAEMAGISRVMGGYHIQADNLAGLELGRRVAGEAWAKLLRHYGGAPVPGGPGSPPAQAPHEE
jgi:hypothetical protein